jgi:hypothetical protein
MAVTSICVPGPNVMDATIGASQPPSNSDEGIVPGREDDSVPSLVCILALDNAEGDETNGCVGLHGRSTFECHSH